MTLSASFEDIHAFDADGRLPANGLKRAGLNADAKSLRRRNGRADSRIVHSILPFLSDLSDFAMPDGVIYPVGSSIER